MKKAILIFAHKDPEYLNLFAEQLLFGTDGNTDIYFHIDKNNNRIAGEINHDDNVFIIENNIPIKWGNDSMVKAMVNCFTEIVDHGKEYDYFLILTGQDIMVRKGLDEFLEENRGRIFIEAKPAKQGMVSQVLRKFPELLCASWGHNKIMRAFRSVYYQLCIKNVIPVKKINYDYEKLSFWYSFNWSAMPYDVLKYIVDFLKYEKGFLDIYMRTYLPEDIFLATVIMNSRYSNSVVFKEDGLLTKSLTYWKGFDHSRMLPLDMDDIDDISSSECFFARKADLYSKKDFCNYYFKHTRD